MAEETLYTIDGDALARIRHRRNWTPELLASYAHVHPLLITRLESPETYARKGMAEWRKNKCKEETLTRIARALNVQLSYLAPEIGQEIPPPGPPEKPTVQGKPPHKVPGDWRNKADAVNRRRLLTELSGDE